MVRVESMAEAQRVGEDGGGDERGVEAEDDADGGPDEQIGGDEAENLPRDGWGKAAEGFRDAERGAGHCECAPGRERGCARPGLER